MGSQLVTVHNQEENVYVQHRHNGERSWIGLNDRSVEGSFVWTNKEVSKFRFWAPQQPNDWNNQDCVHTLGAKHGYAWNDVPCKSCFNFTCFTDFDECRTHTDNCADNADCTNTVGSYTCTCRAGYSGDGRTCNDIDECSTNSHSCDASAICSNSQGSHSCACKPGYSGNGKTCVDIDECTSGVHGCHRFGSCINNAGSYSCSCNRFYTGDGKTCRHSASECQNYQSLSGRDRHVSYGNTNTYCDSGLSGWFRFEGSAGSRMATSCQSKNRCNTHAPGYLTGGHPSVADGQVRRRVCFHWDYSCCNWSKSITVRNCGAYYVYYITGTPTCSLRYCGTY
ncbi:uromodulin-like isoform X2 [Stylophora pistillata]|uniref:uromodulin-like isoform X2 n=1 Tax=Stylophora pistillata TaxID=50429 RepID=UPI000C056297|nr:uromodulin-like isoform X2 [Stylophora pistillata]